MPRPRGLARWHRRIRHGCRQPGDHARWPLHLVIAATHNLRFAGDGGEHDEAARDARGAASGPVCSVPLATPGAIAYLHDPPGALLALWGLEGQAGCPLRQCGDEVSRGGRGRLLPTRPHLIFSVRANVSSSPSRAPPPNQIRCPSTPERSRTWHPRRITPTAKMHDRLDKEMRASTSSAEYEGSQGSPA